MTATYNKVTIIGNLGRDPETRALPSGDSVTSFSVATSERRRDGSELTTWFSASAFGKLGETCQAYLRKGSNLQFQKQLRLQEARRLMLGEDLDAASAGSRVGYHDAAHFNREYKSLFGVSPMRDVHRLRDAASDVLSR